jgi:hypothetical protein
MNSTSAIKLVPEQEEQQFVWPSFLGADGLAAAVKVKIPSYLGVGATFATKDGISFAVYSNGRYRYVAVLANRLGYLRLEPDSTSSAREIWFGDFLADVKGSLWTEPEDLYPDAVGVIQ